MLSALRASSAPRNLTRTFSTSQRTADLAKLTLIGRLVKDPEARLTKNDKEYITYTIATSGPLLAPNAEGQRLHAPSSFHRVLSFSENANKYLRTLRKGTTVYAEAGFELKEPDPNADPNTPQGQRQIFLKHESLRVVASPPKRPTESSSTENHDEHQELEGDRNARPLF
ncbi:hypothetical protein CPB83DRAFT_843264 [Crepidotus variabilis]|uniref:Single-stranded DNA-binding protein n=1 Tax=Crepidotus variabilis TaxID=179855 RepID=A0A9P6EUK7_9AGAR|nr:hypothetical protein CPB83DRAFT_843264 [Crepidotus variabilis]